MQKLKEKVNRYRELLERAIKDVKIGASPLHDVAEDYLTMAKSYYQDGLQSNIRGGMARQRCKNCG